ncbi:hypothetical protein FQN57_005522 [Myotisia sp. PD_48]|nr:hypothetical protein FQN57_005522 [Myotisia sp. PD_48]
MPGMIDDEPQWSGIDNSVFKKRKRDTESENGTVALPTPSHDVFSCLQPHIQREPSIILPNYSQIDPCRGRSSPTSRSLRPHLRTVVPLKKRRLDPKSSQSFSQYTHIPQTRDDWSREDPFSTSLGPSISLTAGARKTLEEVVARQMYNRHQISNEHNLNAIRLTRNVAATGTPTGASSRLAHPVVIHSGSKGNSIASKETLAPCHICHRRPTTRTVLDAYADCEICLERTCYVCLRECNGLSCREWAIHSGLEGGMGIGWEGGDGDLSVAGRRICSSCSVEGISDRGQEIVRCLVCYERGGGEIVE